MAGEFLRAHGIDIDAEMSHIQDGQAIADKHGVISISNVSIPSTPAGSTWDIAIRDEKLESIVSHQPGQAKFDNNGVLLAPSLCHPHIHLDKAFLLSHPRYSHLQIQSGDFKEAMSLTGQAKAQFEHTDLLERGQRVIDESIAAGVTHVRAFVEVDAGVEMKCLDAGLQLKKDAERRCVVQLCAFAQLPLFSSSSGDEDGNVIRGLVGKASGMEKVEVIGSTPYVEADRGRMERNVEFMVDLSIRHNKHLDFHLDYNIDPQTTPMVWHVIKTLKSKSWAAKTENRTVVLGHCTRLTLFTPAEWLKLAEEIGDLPISFVGLPTSDLFMMRNADRTRGTLDIPVLIKDYNLNACIGINNIGNAFTPHGSCDPLTLACNGVGVYQAGAKQDAEILFECVSTRARRAIGLGREQTDRVDLELKVGDRANLVLFGSEKSDWRTRKSVSEAVYLYDHCRDRKGFFGGVAVT